MNRIVKVISIYLTFSLALPLIPGMRAEVSARAVRQQEDYHLSAEGIAAAGRFRNSGGRAFADLEIVLKELGKPDGTPSSDRGVGYRIILKRQLLELLGTPSHEGENDQITYNHNYGQTTFYFDGERLKEVLTLSEPIYWYAPPPQSAAKRLWYRTKRWTRKIIGLIF